MRGEGDPRGIAFPLQSTTAMDAARASLAENAADVRDLVTHEVLSGLAVAIVSDDAKMAQGVLDKLRELQHPYPLAAVRERKFQFGGDSMRPTELAVELDARQFLRWWRSTQRCFDDGFELLRRCALRRRYDIMRYLLSNDEVERDLRSKLQEDHRRLLDLVADDADEIEPEFKDILNKMVTIYKELPGYPFSAFDEDGVPWVLEVWHLQAEVVDDYLGLLNPTIHDHERWFGYLFSYPTHITSPVDLGDHFLRLIKARSLSDSDRKEIVRYYQTVIEALKHVETFDYLVRKGFYEPKESFIMRILDVSPPLGYISGQTFRTRDFHCWDVRSELYFCLIFGLQRISGTPDSAWLAKAILLVEPGAALADCYGLIRVLLYHGANPDTHVIRRLMDKQDSERYQGLLEDIWAVKCFLRWGERQSIGGLPREILEMIMYSTWEPTPDES